MLLENRGRSVAIRVVEPDDADWLAKIYADEEFFSLYCSNAQSISGNDFRRSLEERSNSSPASVGFVEYVVVLPGNERIGLCSLGNYSPLHRRVEILVGIVDPAQRHGRGIEATILLLDLAFNHYGMNKVYSYIYAYNEYSEKISIKLGFRQEGLLKEHHFYSKKKKFVDLYINGMTLADFRASRKMAKLSLRLVGRDVTLQPIRLTGEELPITAERGEELRRRLMNRF